MRTSFYSILCIVIRLGAVFLVMRTLLQALSVVLFSQQAPDPTKLLESGAAIVFVLVIAFLLWVYPGVLARVAAGRSSHQVFESPIAATEIQWISFTVLGLYFVLEGLVGLSYSGIQLMLFDAIATSPLNRREMAFGLVYWIVQAGLGLALALGARGLVGLLHQLRHGAGPGASADIDVLDGPQPKESARTTRDHGRP